MEEVFVGFSGGAAGGGAGWAWLWWWEVMRAAEMESARESYSSSPLDD